jgi:hypothetical protein
MFDYLLQFLPALLLFCFGGALIWEHHRQKCDMQDCIIPVTATIVDVGRVRQRNGYKYFSSITSYGEANEETVIHIDPMHPQKIRVDCGEGSAIGHLVLGIGIIVTGVFWMIAGFFWN